MSSLSSYMLDGGLPPRLLRSTPKRPLTCMFDAGLSLLLHRPVLQKITPQSTSSSL
jgi:hypothetical protein